VNGSITNLVNAKSVCYLAITITVVARNVKRRGKSMKVSEKIKDIIEYLKYRYCNNLGECKDCSYRVNCYVKVPLNKIIGILKCYEEQEIMKEKIRDEIRD